MAVPKRRHSKTRGRKRRTHWKAKENLALLDGQMEGKEFICGNNFTLADIMLFCFLHFGTTVGQNIDPELKNINSWFEKVKERPSAAA